MHKSIGLLLVVTVTLSLLSFSGAATAPTPDSGCLSPNETVSPDCGGSDDDDDDHGGSCCVSPSDVGVENVGASGVPSV
jgi:hypothetical protein